MEKSRKKRQVPKPHKIKKPVLLKKLKKQP